MAAGLQYSTQISATSSGQQVAYAINAQSVLIINDGTGSIYADVTTTSGATTDDHQIKTGESISIEAKQGHYTGLSVTTTVGGTATVRVVALR